MKNKYFFLLSFALFTVGLLCWLTTEDQTILPQPTLIKIGDEEGNQDKRQAWFDLMHQAAPGTDWKGIELQNSKKRHHDRIQKRSKLSVGQRSDLEEEIIPGILLGEWQERGSLNQAGSVLATEYDSLNNKILTISAGGTLWRGTLDDFGWEVINQDLRFNGSLLRYIEGPNGRRLLAQTGRVPHFSDDDGLTWTAATGISFIDNWGTTSRPIVLKNETHTIYLLAKPDYWSNISLYKSTDKGETFTSIKTFNQSDMGTYALCNPHGTNDVYFLNRTGLSTLSVINQDNDQLELVSNNIDFTMGNVRANLVGTQIDTTIRFYTYNGNNVVHQSEDFGTSWIAKGSIPETPWGVGMYVLPSNPDMLITGGVECFRSYDAGQNWALMNGWGDYYSDPIGKLHADMMYFKEFKDINGENFILISNHGGLNISWDEMSTVVNIGTQGLNVGQFYDVSTDPLDKRYIYAGTQDQGFQRGFSPNPDEVIEMDQVISGDYGHTVFTKNGSHLWTVYPGGWVSLYTNPQTDGGPSDGWTVESEDESVWIPPIMPDPNPASDVVYLAGGSVDGGPGSYIIKLSQPFGSLTATQIPFDFKAESGSEVSAMATSPLNSDHWYAATTNGRFFTSIDRGETWEQTVSFLPNGHYLYGAAIYPSKIDENTIYFAGSGYSNPAVYKSTDNGVNFSAISDGLPSTLVFGLDGDSEEQFLYAATEAGPYVYYMEEGQWYDLAGMTAPNQTYWSVEYLEDDESKTVRFGTYGRGAWDFQISDTPVATKELPDVDTELGLYPNPSNGIVNLNTDQLLGTEGNLKVYSLEGKLVYAQQFDYKSDTKELISIDLSHLTKGSYVVSAISENGTKSQQLVLQ